MASGFQETGFQFSGFQEFNTAGPGALTDVTDILQLPINCVVAGQQKEPLGKLMHIGGGTMTGPLKNVFNE